MRSALQRVIAGNASPGPGGKPRPGGVCEEHGEAADRSGEPEGRREPSRTPAAANSTLHQASSRPGLPVSPAPCARLGRGCAAFWTPKYGVITYFVLLGSGRVVSFPVHVWL